MVDTKNSQEIQKPLTQQENKVPEAERTLNTEEVGISNRFLRDKTPDILSKDQLAEIEKEIEFKSPMDKAIYELVKKDLHEKKIGCPHCRKLINSPFLFKIIGNISKKQGFLLGTISKLKEERDKIESAIYEINCMFSSFLENFSDSHSDDLCDCGCPEKAGYHIQDCMTTKFRFDVENICNKAWEIKQKLYEQITADLKFYEDKLKEMQK